MATNSNKGRFSDRLKKMRINRIKKNKNLDELEDSNMMYANFIKVMAAIPLMVYDNVFDKNDNVNKEISYDDVNEKDSNSNIKQGHVVVNRRKEKREIINSINVSQLKKKQNVLVSALNNISNKNTIIDTIGNEITEERIKELEKKIINLIKKDLVLMVNEYEMLESELYILKEVNGDEKTLEQCKKNIDEIKKMICKIDILKSKYDFLKDNYDFEYFCELDDNELHDKIIELKKLVDDGRVKLLVEDYKLLDAYKYLYLRIDQIHDDYDKFEDEKEKKRIELEERDIDFEELKKNVCNVDKFSESYDTFVKNQQILLDELNERVGKINSYEIEKYRIKGVGDLLFNSLGYLALLIGNPLRGLVPYIASQTLITKNLVGNLSKGLTFEKDTKIVYRAFNYSSEISRAINNIDIIDKSVDMALDDLVKFKMLYNDKFKEYHGDFYEYREVISNINDMENKILGNKIKIEIVKKKMKEKELENEKVMKKIRKLNDRENI